jgi:hypothetical protein
MALHLEEIAAAVAPGAHAILVLDQAGWHVSKALPVPPNITLVSLPPKSPVIRVLHPHGSVPQNASQSCRWPDERTLGADHGSA